MSQAEIQLKQPALPGMCPITDAVHVLAHQSEAEDRGAIFTRREVVDFVLDLVEYTPNKPLYKRTLLEPSFGNGDFLLPAIERLLAAWMKARKGDKALPLDDCIRGVELHHNSYERTRVKVVELLQANGVLHGEAERLASKWLVQSDFLLVPLDREFDCVIGNPPYVRQEMIPAPLLQEYRKRYATLYDRADLYVPFIERSLRMLRPRGQLSFICADRWTKNRYGGPLRSLVASEFHLKAYVDMVDTPAFLSDVIAYPAITVIERTSAGPTLVAEKPEIDSRTLKLLAKGLRGGAKSLPRGVHKLDRVVNGAEPWVLHPSDTTDLVRRIEASFPTLEEAGCKVGIGVATGADSVYIGKFEELDVESDRKLPLAMTRDIATGRVVWRGYGVINPFTDEGPLVDLEKYPRLRRYLEAHRPAIASRHVAQKDSGRWYRTIDRITPALTWRSKLLIPDIKGKAQVVYEEGKLYPHHNLYYVVSESWDLRALQAVLLSDLTRLFVATYSTKMRGGFLRFQAQYLRRIRLPRWEGVPDELRVRLTRASEQLDVAASNAAVADLYGLTTAERAALSAQGGHGIGASELSAAG
jgi:hypothetical protein